MKKSQLRNIIRESIKELLTEQPILSETTMLATVCTCGGYKASTTFFNPAGSTGPCMTPNNPFPSSTNTPDQQGNPQYAVGTWSGGGGASCNSGYAYTTYFANDPPTAHSNPEYTWFDQVHTDANGNCIPNPIDCGPGSDNDPTDPCKKFATLPQSQQDGCCEKCLGNISPQDPCYQYCKCCDSDPIEVEEVKCSCCKNGMPISMQQMVPANPGCVGAENTYYAGLNVTDCALSQVSGGPGPKCKKPPVRNPDILDFIF